MNGFYRLYNSLKIIFIESIRSSICHPIKRFFCPYNIRIIRIIIYCIKVADSIMPFMNQLFSQIASYRLLSISALARLLPHFQYHRVTGRNKYSTTNKYCYCKYKFPLSTNAHHGTSYSWYCSNSSIEPLFLEI